MKNLAPLEPLKIDPPAGYYYMPNTSPQSRPALAVQSPSPQPRIVHATPALVSSWFDLYSCLYLWHFIGKGPIWSVLETEILKKIREMVKKLKKIIFLIWSVRPPETPLCWQNTEKVIPRLYSRSIVHGNKMPIWSVSVAVMYSERSDRKQVPHC